MKMEGFEMELLRRLSREYLKATKRQKTELIKQYSSLTGVRKDTARKRFNRYLDKQYKSYTGAGHCGRRRKYNHRHGEVIKRCWQLAFEICAEKLHPMIGEYVEQLEGAGLLKVYDEKVLEEVKQISLGSLKRITGKFKRLSNRRKQKGNAFIYKQIPIQAEFGRYAQGSSGHVEVDFVEHNGGSTGGRYIITGVYTELKSQRTVRACGWGKNLESIGEIDRIAHSRIPFKVLHYHPDNDKCILKVLLEGFGRVVI